MSISYIKSVDPSTAWRNFYFQWCMRINVDWAMMRWSSGDGATEHRVITIAPSRHPYRTIAIVQSRYRFCVPSHHHHCIVASSSSLYRHRIIASSHYRPKLDVAMVLSGFHRKPNFACMYVYGGSVTYLK